MELPSAAKDLAGPAWPWSNSKQEWPDTGIRPKENSRTPPRAHKQLLKELPGGQGVPGGPRQSHSVAPPPPLPVAGLNKDTLYRIHGHKRGPGRSGATFLPAVFRMVNDDVIDLYDRVGISTKVVVLASNVG